MGKCFRSLNFELMPGTSDRVGQLSIIVALAQLSIIVALAHVGHYEATRLPHRLPMR